FLDSVNVPPPALLPALWAPVGLRYHGLHHLLPRLPYHNLGRAHRRLSSVLPARSAYHRINHQGLIAGLGELRARLKQRRAG
ncbi:MAG: fatty acid desaturase, partial [Caulobacter sp.]|nr:fatty acid desaturase [Caulobacter sp.]